MARPSIYSDELAATICDRIMAGEPLTRICSERGMPGYTTVMRWAQDNEEFRAKYSRAREAQGDADADKVGDVTQMVLEGKLDPQAARVAMIGLMWTAGRRAPKKYGERVDVHGAGLNGEHLLNIARVELVAVEPADHE